MGDKTMSKLIKSQTQSIERMVSSNEYIDAFDFAKEIEIKKTLDYKPSKISGSKTDRLNFVFLTFFFYGMSIGLPWNVFLPIINHFVREKLSDGDEVLQKVFLLILSIIWQVTFVITNLLNLINCKSKKFDQSERIPFVILMAITANFGFIIFIVLNPSKWVIQFLLLSCLVALVNSAACGVIFSSAFYSASKFPINYTNIIIIGASFSSLFNTSISIMDRVVTDNMTMYGITFLVLSLGCLLITFIAHFSLNLSPYYCYHAELSKAKSVFTHSEHNKSYFKIFRLIWPYLLSLWFTVFNTAVIYPFYQQKIKASSTSFLINDEWFTKITCDLTFNVMFLLGNLTALFKRQPGAKTVIGLALLKSVLSPVFFMFCNYSAEERITVPVFIDFDFIYWLGSAIFSYLSGYLISLLMMITQSEIRDSFTSPAALLSSLMLVFGVLGGIQFSPFFEMVVLF